MNVNQLGDDTFVAQAYKKGAIFYVEKPLDPLTMKDLVNKLLKTPNKTDLQATEQHRQYIKHQD